VTTETVTVIIDTQENVHLLQEWHLLHGPMILVIPHQIHHHVNVNESVSLDKLLWCLLNQKIKRRVKFPSRRATAKAEGRVSLVDLPILVYHLVDLRHHLQLVLLTIVSVTETVKETVRETFVIGNGIRGGI
jgi:hypothetical protein